ncbi:hypothetical protein H7I87_19950 [Mycobacterium timonense]|uniref:Uncharacterized protein n=1 Tax=Mycobacterium bouchedurhonense TaxID=701041 RepID=A0AAW5RVS6_MYCBC|nr:MULTISPECIES: hypothetical protein [Mycobacterium avium complex (MAC)]MCV6987758.1 hypothetical protein [Mycobacterium bouchedurhonense]MCV6996949.1 hypothetical protein [Mycobacterium timonense]ORA42086.1 hypothetical protein BST19_26375 [Mycobacterium bouchedurhonense]
MNNTLGDHSIMNNKTDPEVDQLAAYLAAAQDLHHGDAKPTGVTLEQPPAFDNPHPPFGVLARTTPTTNKER